MTTTIRAAVCRSFGEPMTVEQLTLAAPGPDEVQVAIDACAVCHSDVSYVDGLWGGDLPAVWGHEAAGRVTAMGPGVDLEIGQSVVVTLIRWCGECNPCQRGAVVACTATFALDDQTPLLDGAGGPVSHGLRTAGFAEAVVVHHSQVVPVPASVPSPSASLLACGVITGVGAVTNTAAVTPGRSVVVVGCGGVGLNAVQGARIAGAAPIVAVDPQETKLALARRLGATHALNPNTDDVPAEVAEITGGQMADDVIVAVGHGPVIESSYELVGTMGGLVIVGMPASGVSTRIDPGTVAARNQRILGSKMGTSAPHVDIPALAARYQQGELELDGLISKTFTLDHINAAFDEVRAGSALRNVIVF
ncbi:MAG: zinc-binding dehydrogenase [Acidimicrobiales bacterium]